MSPSEASLAPLRPSDTNRGELPVVRHAPHPELRETVVRVTSVVKEYDGRRVLDGVSFELERGRVYSIIGPSGCGKTTLLKSMLGLVDVSAGAIELVGVDVASVSESRVDEVRRRIGVVFQSAALLSSVSVFENVALPLRLHTKKKESEIREVVEHKLGLVGMQDALDRRPSELSGGMKKRCALARAIVMEPDLLFLDEPTSGADPVTAAVLDDLVLDLTRRIGCTAIAVTHEMRTAFRLSHEILMLWKGRIHHKGAPASFIESDDRLINQFVQGRKEGPMTG
ncbi:MAG: ATP-binding cassette domain-containing protein [Planctomycetes bacterium]|nr:ATP-binding cassette domain-containing protein [Planctomycetota bacterium]